MAARQIMELLMDAAQVVNKVEKLISEMHVSETSLLEDEMSESRSKDGELKVIGDVGIDIDNDIELLQKLESKLKVSVAHGRLLERIATETARLNYLTKQGNGIRSVRNLRLN